MIEITYLFPECDYASAVIHKENRVALTIQQHNRMYCLAVNANRVQQFLEDVRREQERHHASRTP